MTWSAKQYSTFEQERTRPVRDLVAAIALVRPGSAVDLGCGPGNSTEVLADRFPGAKVVGVDNSDDMLDSARKRLPATSFELSDIATWSPPAPVDVILANASLQWVPDHATLYPRLVRQLSAGGCLAVQTPDNLEEPAHLLARRIATSPAWVGKIGAVAIPPRHDGRYYYELLKPLCTSVDVWRTTYMHVLAGPQAVVEWFKGSALRPYVQALDKTDQAAFLAEYLTGVTQAYPALSDGTVLLPFPRLFVVATR
jgi:trans-aconitate 2-methyltransferase